MVCMATNCHMTKATAHQRPRLGGLRARAELEPEQAKLRFVAPLAPPVHHGKGLRLSHPPLAEALHRMGVWCGSDRSCRRSRSWSRTKQGLHMWFLDMVKFVVPQSRWKTIKGGSYARIIERIFRCLGGVNRRI